jgi:thioredoxin 1
MSDLQQFNDDNFEQEVLKSSQPVLVDFGAEWCVPCKKLEPIVEDLASNYTGRVKFGQVDVGKSTGIAAKYGIMSVPTILIIEQGQVKEHLTGLVSKDKLVKSIEKLL